MSSASITVEDPAEAAIDTTVDEDNDIVVVVVGGGGGVDLTDAGFILILILFSKCAQELSLIPAHTNTLPKSPAASGGGGLKN